MGTSVGAIIGTSSSTIVLVAITIVVVVVVAAVVVVVAAIAHHCHHHLLHLGHHGGFTSLKISFSTLEAVGNIIGWSWRGRRVRWSLILIGRHSGECFDRQEDVEQQALP